MSGLDLFAGKAESALTTATAAYAEMIDAIACGQMERAQSAAERVVRQATAAASEAYHVASIAQGLRATHRRTV